MTTSGSDRFVIEYVKSVLKDDIPALPTTMKKLIQQAILQRLTADPIGFGKPLRYSLKGAGVCVLAIIALFIRLIYQLVEL